jgi:Ice-binding-like
MWCQKAGSRTASVSRNAGSGGIPGIPVLVAILAMASAFTAPARCYAQITLGTSGPYAVFEVSNSTVTGQMFKTNGAAINGNVALGQNTNYSVMGTSVGGTVYVDTPVSGSISNSTISGNGGKAIVTSLASAGAAATASATSYAGMKSNNSFNTTSSVYSITANSGSAVNVVDVAKSFSLTNGTVTINGNGNSNSQFVFNFAQGLSLTNVTINLTNGATADNIIYNITGGSVSIVGTVGSPTFAGKILDMSGQSGVALSGVTEVGGITTNTNLSITGSVVSVAPELPTIMTAGLACVFALGAAGVGRLRQSKLKTVNAATSAAV